MHIKRCLIWGSIVFCGVWLVSCTHHSAVLRLHPEGELPATYTLYTPKDRTLNPWWQSFGDQNLDFLIEKALSDNFSIRKAWARLRQQEAALTKANASFFPTLTLSGDESKTQIQNDFGAHTSKETQTRYVLGISAGYEVDLWGRINATYKAAESESTASTEDLHAAAISVAASVALNYFEIVSCNLQIKKVQKQLETSKTYKELVELRFQNGLVSALDVYQQRQNEIEIRSRLPLLEAKEKMLRNALNFLLGSHTPQQMDISMDSLPTLEKLPSTGLPVDLLSQRPDVVAAGMRLKAMDWQVLAARANRLPSLTLTGSANFNSEHFNLIFNNWMMSLAGQLIFPIFDADERKAEVERQVAKADETLLTYQETIRTSIREVEDALIREVKQREHLHLKEEEIQIAKKGLAEAISRYQKGLVDYLTVLTQLKSVQSLEVNLILLQSELIAHRITLYRAIGGSWIKEALPDE